MATNYQRGRTFEYRARDKLLKSGAVYVMRAASSKGAADLIALWPESDIDPHAELVARILCRLERLKRIGCDRPDCLLLAGRLDVDLHRAVELVAGGCPPDLAIRILV